MVIRMSVEVEKREGVPNDDHADALRGLGGDIVEDVRARTLSGQDQDGRKFAPYADPSRGGTVTLSRTGQMLAGLGVIRTDKESCEMGYTDPVLAERALAHQEGRPERGIPARPWMGIPEDAVDRAAEELVDDVLKNL